MIRGIFDPTAIWDELLFCHHVFKFIRIKLRKSLLPGDVDLLGARELELGLDHMLLVLQLVLQMDIMTSPMWTLATVPWGFSKAPRIPIWSLD